MPVELRQQRAADDIQMASYASTRDCRQRYIGDFMGDDLSIVAESKVCGCDNCVYKASDPNSESGIDFGYETAALLQTVLETGGRLSVSAIVSVTTAPKRMPKATRHIKSADDCSTFGSLKYRKPDQGSAWRGRGAKDLKQLCFALMARSPPFLRSAIGSDKAGGVTLTSDAREWLIANEFTAQYADFAGEMTIIKPAAMQQSAKRAHKSDKNQFPQRAEYLQTLLQPLITELALANEVLTCHVIPPTAFSTLSALDRTALPSVQQLLNLNSIVGSLFDDSPSLWAPFATELLKHLALDTKALKQQGALFLVDKRPSAQPKPQSAQSVPLASKPLPPPKSTTRKPLASGKENVPPKRQKSKSAKKLAELAEYLPRSQRSAKEQSADQHARAVLKLTRPRGTPLGATQEQAGLPLFQSPARPSRPVSGGARSSAQKSAFFLEAMSPAQRKRKSSGASASSQASSQKKAHHQVSTRATVLKEVRQLFN